MGVFEEIDRELSRSHRPDSRGLVVLLCVLVLLVVVAAIAWSVVVQNKFDNDCTQMGGTPEHMRTTDVCLRSTDVMQVYPR